MHPYFGNLWRNSNFLKFWAGETISLLGSQITFMALPLTAAFMLNATPIQMGILGAAEYAPFLVVGLLAGVWVDRLRRRPILIIANFGRALLLFSIPLAVWFSTLRIEHLYFVAVSVGILSVFFEVAYTSFLPVLVQRENLVEGNSKLEVSRSTAEILGPGIAGMLIQVLTAPITIVLDAISFLISSLLLLLIGVVEQPPVPQAKQQSMVAEIKEGLTIAVREPIIRSIMACSTNMNFFYSIQLAAYVLFVSNELGITPAQLGVIYGVGSIASFPGAMMASWLARRFGLGFTIVMAATIIGIGHVSIPLATGSVTQSVILQTLAQFVIGFGLPLYKVNVNTLRQTITPDHLLGRITASIRFMTSGVAPFGLLIGGFMGEIIGLRLTLAVGGVGVLLSTLWVLFSPVRLIHDYSDTVAKAPSSLT